MTASRTEARHTPGTWTNKDHSTFVWSEHGNVCACGDPHASGHVGYTEVGPGSQYLAEAVANARLIAAAPDLLEALKMARECIAYCRRAHKDAQSGEGIPVEIFLDAAISKAEGPLT